MQMVLNVAQPTMLDANSRICIKLFEISLDKFEESYLLAVYIWGF